MVLARPSPQASAQHPKPGDRILIFKEPWLRLVLSGKKKMEVRGAPYKGMYYLGTGGELFKHTKNKKNIANERCDPRTSSSWQPDAD